MSRDKEFFHLSKKQRKNFHINVLSKCEKLILLHAGNPLHLNVIKFEFVAKPRLNCFHYLDERFVNFACDTKKSEILFPPQKKKLYTNICITNAWAQLTKTINVK